MRGFEKGLAALPCGTGTGCVGVTGKGNKIQRGWRKEVPVAPLLKCMVSPCLDPAHHIWGVECIPLSSLNCPSVLISQALAPLCGPLGWLCLTQGLSGLHPPIAGTPGCCMRVHFFVEKLRSSAGRSCKQCSVVLFSHIIPTHTYKRHK